MEKLLKSKYYTLVVALIFFVFWFLCFIQFSKENHLASSYLVTIESIELTVIGLICAYLLSRYQNMFYVVPWVTYTPFVFARPFTTTTMPYALFIAGGLFFIGLIAKMAKKSQGIDSFFIGALQKNRFSRFSIFNVISGLTLI